MVPGSPSKARMRTPYGRSLASRIFASGVARRGARWSAAPRAARTRHSAWPPSTATSGPPWRWGRAIPTSLAHRGSSNTRPAPGAEAVGWPRTPHCVRPAHGKECGSCKESEAKARRVHAGVSPPALLWMNSACNAKTHVSLPSRSPRSCWRAVNTKAALIQERFTR